MRCEMLRKYILFSICPIPNLINKSLRENYRAKKSMTKKKRNYSKIARSSPTRSSQFFTMYNVPSKNALVCLQLTNCTNHASDRFVRYAIVICNFAKWFLLLNNTMHHSRPLFRGDTRPYTRSLEPGRRCLITGALLPSAFSYLIPYMRQLFTNIKLFAKKGWNCSVLRTLFQCLISGPEKVVNSGLAIRRKVSSSSVQMR
jgi:hypothetical protein